MFLFDVVDLQASSGIGRATATALAQQGFHVILASRSLERLWEVQAEIEAQGLGATCQALELDLCSVPSILKFSKVVEELFGGDDPPGKLQLLVNNAGKVSHILHLLCTLLLSYTSVQALAIEIPLLW